MDGTCQSYKSYSNKNESVTMMQKMEK